MVTFTGGDKLERKLKELAAKVSSGAAVKVGFLAGATYPNGTSIPLVAAIHEFGKWPFMRPTVANHATEWGDGLARVLEASDYNAKLALGQTGEVIKGDVRQTILEVTSPALSPKTIARKSRGGVKRVPGAMGPEKPLIDTGLMWNSVESEVES